MLPTNVLLFKAFNISFVNLKMASSVAVPFLKPNWFPSSKLRVFKVQLFYYIRLFQKPLRRKSVVIWACNYLDSFCFLSCVLVLQLKTSQSGKIPDSMDLLQT